MFVKDVARSNFFIRLKNWEYWPFGVIQFPVIVYYFWLSARARSFFFFSASNPGIVMGGMFGESKYEVLKKVPERYTANTTFVRTPCGKNDVIHKMEQQLRRYKEKVQERHRNPEARRQETSETKPSV